MQMRQGEGWLGEICVSAPPSHVLNRNVGSATTLYYRSHIWYVVAGK